MQDRTSQPGAPEQAAAADLPWSGGRTFDTLDAYLVYREEQGAYDKPFYKRVGPDRYELIAGRTPPGTPRRFFTRADLLREFGFTE